MFLESGPGSDSGVDGPIDWKGRRGKRVKRRLKMMRRMK